MIQNKELTRGMPLFMINQQDFYQHPKPSSDKNTLQPVVVRETYHFDTSHTGMKWPDEGPNDTQSLCTHSQIRGFSRLLFTNMCIICMANTSCVTATKWATFIITIRKEERKCSQLSKACLTDIAHWCSTPCPSPTSHTFTHYIYTYYHTTMSSWWPHRVLLHTSPALLLHATHSTIWQKLPDLNPFLPNGSLGCTHFYGLKIAVVFV